jgi:hypothetical protein
MMRTLCGVSSGLSALMLALIVWAVAPMGNEIVAARTPIMLAFWLMCVLALAGSALTCFVLLAYPRSIDPSALASS